MNALQSSLVQFINKHFDFIVLSVLILLLPIIVYNWRRRELYYYASKLPGPFAFPVLGSIHLVLDGANGIYKFIQKIFHEYPTVVRIWIGPDLYIGTTEPHHLKVLLNQFLDKGQFYHLMTEYFHRALAAAPVPFWKSSRKNISPTFNVSLINSYVDVFAKHGQKLADDLGQYCGTLSNDLFPRIWQCTLDAGCETLADIDSSLMKTEEYLPTVFRIEEILLKRFFSPTLHLNFFWNRSSERKEIIKLWKENCNFVQKMIDLSRKDTTNKKKRFLDHLVDLNENQNVPSDYILEEAQIMLFVGTETSGVAISTVLLLLGIFPEIQQKLDEELFSIFGTTNRTPSLEDVNKMEYLDRVIKETLRLFPPIPFIMRELDSNVQLDNYVFPKGAKILVPLIQVHRNPKYWPDPLKFDPDRFLPKEVEKRPVCSFIPFSYGVRNCIGYKYGLLSMKVMLSTVLRQYRIIGSNYKSIEDIDLLIHVVAKPKKGYRLILEKKLV